MKTYLLLLVSLFMLIGCAQEYQGETTKIQIRFPTSKSQSSLKHYQASSQGSRKAKLTSLDDIDCYAVFVGSEDGLGTCSNIDYSNVDSSGIAPTEMVATGIDQSFGSIEDGGFIELDVEQGTNKTFYIVGFKNSLPTCPDISNLTVADRQRMDPPQIVGSTIANVEGDTMEIDIDISLTDSKSFHNCKDGPFNWEEETTALWDQAIWDQAQWAP